MIAESFGRARMMIDASAEVETVAHVIQIALTPVFLFSGVATLLNVLSTRLARVSDQVDSLADRLDHADAHERQVFEFRLAYLRRRTLALDIAVILAGLGGMATLLAGGLLFVDGLREHAGVALFVAFGAALLLTIGALAGYLYEMTLASIGIRHKAAFTADKAERTEAPDADGPDDESPLGA
jgi:hypothetical protein